MPLRVLEHGQAGTMESVGLEPGTWADVALQGQFLLDLEFILRCAPTSGTASCIYCQSPPYLDHIAMQFPWIHFYVFGHVCPAPEYDPAQPELACSGPLTVQVAFNKTTSCLDFTKDMARTMGERCARDRESLLMICHGQDPIRQMALQVLMRPQYALLDVCGVIPVDYLDGDLILPIYIPNNKIFVGLVVRQGMGARVYDPSVFLGEMGKRPAPPPLRSPDGLTLLGRLLPGRHPVDARL